MTISQNQRAAMRRMYYVDHLTVNAIATYFGVHHSTVRRALNQDYERRKSKKPSSSIIDEYCVDIDQILKKYPKIRATRIFRTLKEKGFQGSYSTVKRVVSERRPRFHRPFVPVKVLPGEEAQMDWAHAGKILTGRAERKLYCFVMTLSWSRATWVDFTLDMETETLLRCHTRAFEYFGGIPRKILYDNMKTVVVDRVGDVVQFNKTFLEYATEYCFEPRICDPYQPQQKGRVERFIRLLRDDFLRGRSLNDLEAARKDLCLWLEQANSRPWPDGRHTTVAECLEKKRSKLLSFPRPIFPKGIRELRSGRTPMVRFDLNDYTIDPNYVRLALTLFYDETEITIYHGESLVARHERCWDRERVIRDPVHIDAVYAMASKGQTRALSRKLLFEEIPETRNIFEHCQQADIPLSRVEQTLAQLATIYGMKALEKAVRACLERKTPTPEAVTQTLSRMVHDGAKSPEVPLILPDRPGVADLDISSHDLSEYDRL